VADYQCPDSLSQLVNCTDDITHWFLENGLLLNPSKTEAVVFGTASRLRNADTTGDVKVTGTSLQFSDSVKLLGDELDQALSMDRHVSNVVSSCNFHIRASATSVHVSHLMLPNLSQSASSVHVSTTTRHGLHYNSPMKCNKIQTYKPLYTKHTKNKIICK